MRRRRRTSPAPAAPDVDVATTLAPLEDNTHRHTETLRPTRGRGVSGCGARIQAGHYRSRVHSPRNRRAPSLGLEGAQRSAGITSVGASPRAWATKMPSRVLARCPSSSFLSVPRIGPLRAANWRWVRLDRTRRFRRRHRSLAYSASDAPPLASARSSPHFWRSTSRAPAIAMPCFPYCGSRLRHLAS